MTIADKLSWIGGMMGLFMGFSVISGVEILYWLFFIILCKKKGHVDPENTGVLSYDSKVKENEKIKQLEEKFMKQVQETDKQKEQIGDLEKKFEILQMIQKQSEFGDSHAGSFFDAIFRTSVDKQENDIQEETV